MRSSDMAAPGLDTNDDIVLKLPARPRKQPRQARSVALVEALKTAGRDVLEREGREALSIYRLSDYSGVAISSIYEYFPTMESLIAAIFEDYRADTRQQIILEIHALPASATLYDGIELVLRTGLAALHRWEQIDSQLSIKAAYYAGCRCSRDQYIKACDCVGVLRAVAMQLQVELLHEALFQGLHLLIEEVQELNFLVLL